MFLIILFPGKNARFVGGNVLSERFFQKSSCKMEMSPAKPSFSLCSSIVPRAKVDLNLVFFGFICKVAQGTEARGFYFLGTSSFSSYVATHITLSAPP